MIHICGPKTKVPDESVVINTTSRSNNWSKGLSPFFCGPVDLYKWNGKEYIAKNVENAYQFSKVYYCHLDKEGNPSEEYFKWAEKGWNSDRAFRYPMGKGVSPAYSFWNGEKLTYIEARKKIYIPIYSKAVVRTDAYNKLVEMIDILGDVWLWDFDGYDHRAYNMDYDEVINSTVRKMGHAFVIAMLLEKYL